MTDDTFAVETHNHENAQKHLLTYNITYELLEYARN